MKRSDVIFSDFFLIGLGQQRKESRNERVSTDFCYDFMKQIREKFMQFVTKFIYKRKCHNLTLLRIVESLVLVAKRTKTTTTTTTTTTTKTKNNSSNIKNNNNLYFRSLD